METVLITGINGSIGRRTAEKLKTRFRVFGIGRRSACTVPGVEYRKLDISDTEGLEELFSQVRFDAVIHLAAVVHLRRARPEAYDRINRRASLELFDIARRHQVGTCLFASTVEVYGSPEGVVDENTPVKPRQPYGESKLAAEKGAADFPRYAVMRLAPVYGASDMGNVDKRFVLPKLKCGVRFGRGNYAFSFCSIDRVAAFVESFLTGNGESGVYVLSDPLRITPGIYFQWARKVHRIGPVISVPVWLGYAGIAVCEGMLRLTGHHDPFLSCYNFKKLLRGSNYRGYKAQRVWEKCCDPDSFHLG